MKRRRFILGLAGTAVAGWTGWQLSQSSTVITTKPNHPKKKNNLAGWSKTTRNSKALGTTVSITVFYNNVAKANNAIDQAFAAIAHVEQLMSLYQKESQLCQLNRDGFLRNPHPDLIHVLQKASNLSELTDGAFDVTVQPLWSLHNKASNANTTPTESEIATALKRIDWRQISISPERIDFRQSETSITLNGIAQGFAADAARKALQQNGIQHALIDSGEIGTLGTPAEKPNWNIGIKHPRTQKEYLGVTALENRCLATSGDYESHFNEDFSSHHLLDARTGYSPNELASVSVIAPTATEADALSTAVFLAGLQRGKQIIESIPHTDALFVTKSGRQVKTSNFPLVS